MIIVSIGAKTLKAANEQIEKCSMADLIELRIDKLSLISLEKIHELIKKYPLLITLRSKQEGGNQNYTLPKREALLKKIIDLKPKYVDLEFARDQKLISYTKKKSPKTKIILSYHAFNSAKINIESKLIQMKKWRCFKYKIAIHSNSVIKALKMLLLIKKHRDFIGIVMGEKGVCTRLLGPIYNQPITYASLDSKKTASGQLSLKELTEFYQYPSYNQKTQILGLIGNPISQSPGLKTYNSLFAKEKINAIYLNFELKKNEFKKFIEIANELGFLGLSITIPFKEKAGALIMNKALKGKSSINTFYFQRKKLFALNTDGQGALEMLEEKKTVKNKKVLIIGAGGTSMGIGAALKKGGAKITIMNRTDFKAKALAKKLQVKYRPFKELINLKEIDYDILVQTTSVGDKKKCLLPPSAIFPKKTILDVVINETKLLKLGKKKDCVTYSGKEFWTWQAKLQYEYWFKKKLNGLREKLKANMP